MEDTAEVLSRLFSERFLSFARVSAVASSRLASRAAAVGSTLGVVDCQIAAIAAVHGFTVATRDTASFLAAGVAVVNPWEE